MSRRKIRTGAALSSQPSIQPKLTIGAVDSPMERQADEVADRVMRMADPVAGTGSPVDPNFGHGTILRACASCEDESKIRKKPRLQRKEVGDDESDIDLKPLIQRNQNPEEEMPIERKPLLLRNEMPEEEIQQKPILQRNEIEEDNADVHLKSLIQRACPRCEEKEMMSRKVIHRFALEQDEVRAKEAPGATPVVTNDISSQVQGLQGRGSPLSSIDHGFFESRMGADFSGVRVHTGGSAETLARQVNARAFTYKNNIVMGKGEYSPGSQSGRRLMAHELTHVMQQGQAPALQRAPMRTKPAAASEAKSLRTSVAGTLMRAPDGTASGNCFSSKEANRDYPEFKKLRADLVDRIRVNYIRLGCASRESQFNPNVSSTSLYQLLLPEHRSYRFGSGKGTGQISGTVVFEKFKARDTGKDALKFKVRPSVTVKLCDFDLWQRVSLESVEGLIGHQADALCGLAGETDKEVKNLKEKKALDPNEFPIGTIQEVTVRDHLWLFDDPKKYKHVEGDDPGNKRLAEANKDQIKARLRLGTKVLVLRRAPNLRFNRAGDYFDWWNVLVPSRVPQNLLSRDQLNNLKKTDPEAFAKEQAKLVQARDVSRGWVMQTNLTGINFDPDPCDETDTSAFKGFTPWMLKHFGSGESPTQLANVVDCVCPAVEFLTLAFAVGSLASAAVTLSTGGTTAPVTGTAAVVKGIAAALGAGLSCGCGVLGQIKTTHFFGSQGGTECFSFDNFSAAEWGKFVVGSGLAIAGCASPIGALVKGGAKAAGFAGKAASTGMLNETISVGKLKLPKKDFVKFMIDRGKDIVGKISQMPDGEDKKKIQSEGWWPACARMVGAGKK